MIDEFKKDVANGLEAAEKSIPSKYFYDKKGDELFIEIMHLPEYYVTNAELEIFKTQTSDIVDALNLQKETYFELIEFGAGDGLKTVELLRFLDNENYKFDYIPIDISQNALNSIKKRFENSIPNVSVKPMLGDYFKVLNSLKNSSHKKVVLFLGSNIGNMDDEMAASFIYNLGSYLNNNDEILLGVDLIKSESVVLPAYNDSQGVTREFNFNLLRRINKELEADFIIDNFSHQPEYSEETGVVKSFLVSAIDQSISINKLNKKYNFKKGEKMQTEISRKYNDSIIQEIIEKTDLKISGKLSDSRGYFSDYILIKQV